MPSYVNFIIAVFTLGQISLCLTLLMTRSAQKPSRVPLSIFLAACAIISLEPVFAVLMPALRFQTLALELPAYLTLAPALWLYVQSITAEKSWKLEKYHFQHFILTLMGLVVAGLIIILPTQTLEHVFNEEKLGGSLYLGILLTIAFLLILSLIGQSGLYVFKIIRLLNTYRHRLKDQFANMGQRELLWINALVIIFTLLWGLLSLALLSENIFNQTLMSETVGKFMILLLVWTLGLWGLRQAPAFDESQECKSDSKPETLKYSRSALGEEQALRIAKKIKASMQKDQLYLDSTITLSKLAAHIGVSTNHVSQTLNETMSMNFFDYINQWRIEEAKPILLTGDVSILNIALAVGYNSSSSFYKAFKKETGKTPKSYRSSYKNISE
ncbi:helix-turn-helix transcriptional regulator [Temperatibacter marinus]|uniref:Helix-turn-helix transcriptional regulator n=1 Tax=Temperatibacter marinus TaxID=1456591 RepID=A0AA52EC56_9PROT|nr:helix-turn-helix transcriptional regulator [Temperatibacter marinus]WND02010.1 helix-turn-helix transcriptional regulator [Temperatibacter marinus]